MRDGMKLAIVICFLTLFFFLEWTFPLFKGRKHRIRHALPNVWVAVINGLIISLCFSFATVWVIELSARYSFGILRMHYFHYWVEFLLAFLLFDLWMYLWHWGVHQFPFFWRFHRMHHNDLEMDVTTALRFHPGEIIFSSIARLVILSLFGLELIHLVVYEICLQPIILFHHSNVALPEKVDRVLRAVIVTPNMHRVHHSEIPQETNSNYASIFSFWDRIFKSFAERSNVQDIIYGLESMRDSKWETFKVLMAVPFLNRKQSK